MIEAFGQKLYSADEVSLLLGVSRETLGIYAKRMNVPDRRIQRVRYYTEEEIQIILQIPDGQRTPDRRRKRKDVSRETPGDNL